MKITDITVCPVWVGHRNQCVVKVETDEGIGGLGEAGLSGRELAVAGAVQHYREFLVGRDPMRRGALWQEMYRSQYFEGGRVLTAAISAIDIALHDIAGKALGVPVYQLLGGRQRDRVPCFATTGGGSVEQLIENVQDLIEQGWSVIRTGAARPDAGEGADIFEPRESIALTAEWLTRLREAVGSSIVLGIDYHHRLNVAEAASFCQRMPRGTLDFLEEPIRDETPDAYASLRSLTDVPLAIGEEMPSKWAFVPYIERGLTNFVRLDICNVGGFTEAMKVAGWAEAHYIDLMPHNPLGPICTAASIHLAAAVPNFAWLEESRRRHDEALFPVQPALDGTAYPVPEAPGLGVEFDEELAGKQEFKFWEAPHLRRRDGSHTNW
ncbi:MAG: mandelate racemase/muconate lactonizing enzyme family protein [Candidatus Brocadiaceae bacterium]